MARYFESFGTVEVQQTFYDPPRPGTLAGWKAKAPYGFRFAMKAWQLITHPAGSPTYRRLRRSVDGLEQAGYFGRSRTVRWAWAVTYEAAQALGAEVVLFQCPSSFVSSQENIDNLRSFFEAVERGRLRFAWEPRGDWPAELVSKLCQDLDLVHAVDPFSRQCVTDTAYFRLHGIGGYRYSYSDKDLAALLAFCVPHNFCYVYFNNASMFQDALRLQEMVQGCKL